jgi:hypothetical protein
LSNLPIRFHGFDANTPYWVHIVSGCPCLGLRAIE